MKYVPGILATIALFSIVVWLALPSGYEVAARVPGTDQLGSQAASSEASLVGAAKLVKLDGVPADLPGAWPRFRGKNLDNVAAEEKGLATEWPPAGPRALWSLDVGEGYAAPAILRGRVYLMDYDRGEQADAIRCFSLADGKEIWRYSYPVRVKRQHGMSRTVPAVTERHVLAFGPKCHVTCLDASTGELRWQLDLVKQFKAKVPNWYAGQCPLIDGDRAILATGGDELMIAVDLATGNLLWKSPNPRGWVMTHSSIVPMEFRGRKMYVYCASGGVAGVSAADGALLWDTDAWQILIAAIASPLPLGDGRIFLSGGYDSGSLFLRLAEKDGKILAEPGTRLSPEVFGSPQQTPILFDDHIYGVRPDEQLVCLDLEGKIVWASGSANKFGLGPYLIADGLLYVMNDKAHLTLARATPEGFKPLAQAKVLADAHDSWGPMAIAGGRLIVRDLTRMVCLDVKTP